MSFSLFDEMEAYLQEEARGTFVENTSALPRCTCHPARPLLRKFTHFTKEQKCALEAQFQFSNYCSKRDRARLASETKLSQIQIINWFSRRRKLDKQKQKDLQEQQQQDHYQLPPVVMQPVQSSDSLCRPPTNNAEQNLPFVLPQFMK